MRVCAHVCVKTTQTAEGFFFLLVSEGETRVYKKKNEERQDEEKLQKLSRRKETIQNW